jgi:hypothetical protein
MSAVALAAVAAALLLCGGGAADARASSCASPPVTPAGPCGMNLENAFAHFTTGDPGVVISYVEGGINWHLPQAHELVDVVYLNWRELPVPCTGTTMFRAGRTEPCARAYSHSIADYDVDHDGVVNVEEWAHDPRVSDSNENGYLDPEDLIAAFSDGIDHDGNGYANDISGWDFYDNQNDPQTVDSTYDHSDEQMLVLHRECPHCLIMPVKAGAEALDRTKDLAKAWLFSADAGASVVVSTTADLGYSSFMRQAVGYLQARGVAMVESSNDFDSTDHQGGMFWPGVIPGNGAVATAAGDAWTRSDYTSWGPHNVLTAATNGGTTSESTPTLGGAIALLLSWGRQAAATDLISSPLTGPEAEQELIATATRVTDPSLPWPGEEGDWNPQYGYGIPDVYRAMQQVAAGEVPPVARIESPAWYSLFDPTVRSGVPIRGTVTTRGGPVHWVLQAGLGGDPKSWFTVGSGTTGHSFAGLLGVLSLAQIPQSFWEAAFSLSQTKELETTQQYAVTLRLVATDASGAAGEDRRAINVVHDRSWLGRPLPLSAGGESQPALVDLQGSGRLDLVFADADGRVHAIDPLTRHELPGWPVTTDPVTAVPHAGVDPGYEAIIADVAVGDLTHTGHLDVVATTEEGRVFAWDSHGNLLPGWPQVCDTGVSPPPIPRPALPYRRLPKVGASGGGPVLFGLGGGDQLDVVQAGWDGYVHVWRADGSALPGWPVKVSMPAGFTPAPGYVLIDDEKLDAPPAVAYLEGRDKPPDLVIRSQYTETLGSGLKPFPHSFVFAYHSDGTGVAGWPARLLGLAEFYNSAQEFVTEGDSAPVAADVGETGSDSVAVAPMFTPPYLLSGTGQVQSVFTSIKWPPSSLDIPISFTSSAAFGRLGSRLELSTAETGGLSLARALLNPNTGEPIENFESAFPASGGGSVFGFPRPRQGIDFLGEPIIAPVSSGGQESVIDGGDSNAMHAYGPLGVTSGGFPKWTTGWNLFSPAAGDLLSIGRVDLVSATREGYLFVWGTAGSAAANNQWWRLQHDEWSSGNYGSVTRPPGAIRRARWRPGETTMTFTAPGSTWYTGTPASYRLTFEPQDQTLSRPATVAAGGRETIPVPAGTQHLSIQAVGPTGLLGTPALLE